MDINTYTEAKIAACKRSIDACISFLNSDDAKKHRNIRVSTQRRFANLTEIYDRLIEGGAAALTPEEVYYYNALYRDRDVAAEHVSAV